MLEIQNLRVGYYEDIDVLKDVSLKADELEITSVLGTNGVGKSTLLKTICGFLEPKSGDIKLKGEEISGIKPWQAIERGMVYIPQDVAIFPDMTARENLEVGAWTHRRDGKRIEREIDRNFDRFPILKSYMNQKAGNLSGGQQRILELARALMNVPDIMLVDEPTAGLAPKPAKKMYEKLTELKHENVTTLLVDQNVRQAINISDYIYVLALGKNKVDGPKDQFDNIKQKIQDWF